MIREYTWEICRVDIITFVITQTLQGIKGNII